MKIKAIITGTTGMVGEGVLNECLQHPDVEQVLIINRKPGGVTHPKLKEVIHANFFDLSPIENQLAGYNACFFCLGVSSVGMKEPEFYHLTYELTMHVAETLSRLNRDMTFCYVSGAGTDSTEKGSLMWARVKGKTENTLIHLPFRKVYNFRPGFLKASEGAKNVKSYYKFVDWLYPIGRAIYPAGFCTLKELGLAMINTVTKGYSKSILEVKDIVELARA
jgi:uncharacterized protein YbjT (DUF2867 family)